MPPLSSMLLQREVATLREVDEALARQALYGGDLVTNLIEVAQVEEPALLAVLSAFQGIPAWTPGLLPPPDPAAVALFPRDIAVEHAVVPMRASTESCDVVVIEPLSPALLEDLRFSLGLRLEQFVAIPARVRLALSRTYDVPLDRRDLRVLARVEGLADPSPSEAPPPPLPGDSLLPPRFPDSPALTPPDDIALPASAPDASPPQPLVNEALIQPADDASSAEQPEPPSALDPLAVSPPASDSVLLEVSAPASSAPPEPLIIDAPSAPAAPRNSIASSLARSLLPNRMSGRPRSPRMRRKGPFTLAMARDALDEADSHGAMLRVLFDFSRQYFEYSALFLVRDDLAEGVDGSGPGADRERIRGVGVPLDLDGVLREARQARLNTLTIPRTDGVDAALRQDLRRPMNREVLVIPVLIRQRVIALLYGDDGSDAVDMQGVGDVLALVPLVSAALERLILRKKLHGGSSRPPAGTLPSRETLRGLQGYPGLSGPAGGQAPPGDTSLIGGPGPVPSISAPFPAPFPSEESTRAGPPRRTTASFAAASERQAEASVGIVSDQSPKRRITANMGVVVSPVPPPPPVEPPAVVEPSAVSIAATSVPVPEPVPPAKDATPSLEVSPAAGSIRTPAATSEPELVPAPSPVVDEVADAPVVDVGEVDESDDMVMAVLDELQRSPEPQRAQPEEGADQRESFAATCMISEGPRLPPERAHPSDVGLPLVMVDVRAMAGELMDALEADELPHGEAARVRDEIVRLGDDAAEVIASRFPGPTTVTPDPMRTSLPPVDTCGPVLTVASMLGRKAIPFIEPLTHAADSNVRFWAVLLLGELGGSVASRAVFGALFDDDERVRMGARASMRTAAGRRAWVADVREKLRRIAESAGEPLDRRVAAVESLGALRERATVPLLIELIDAPEAQLREAAHAALQTVARRSLPASSEAWDAWWEKNVARDRIEWLIDALAEEDDPHGPAAFDELEEAAGDDFGYQPGQSREECVAAAARFRSWWHDEGTTRVTDPPGALA